MPTPTRRPALAAMEKESLRRDLLALGFRRVGFAPAGPLDLDRQRLLEWVTRQHQGSMSWMAHDPALRAEAARHWPGARTVVCCTVPFHSPEASDLARRRDDGRPRARIASYALGRDYHKRVRARLRKGARLVEALGGWAKLACDTSPILEKAYHGRAGTGWVGKNACLIEPETGSWVLLGEIVTDLAVPPDEPLPDHCGSCRQCLDACPTGAFPEPYVLDARRCISYLTIEHRGGVEPPLARRMGDHVFGCDICQEVCPWNRRAPEDGLPDLRPVQRWIRPLLPALARLTRRGWDRWVAGSALRRAGYEGFLRSLAIALGNSRSAEASGALARLARHESPLVREAALNALRRSPAGAAPP